MTEAEEHTKIDMISQRLSLVKTPWPSAIYTVSRGALFEAGASLPAQMDYTVLDWNGDAIESGIWNRSELLKFPNLSAGYYALVVSRNGKVIDQGIFGIVPDPAPLNQKGYFAAGSSLVYTRRELDGKPVPLSALAEIISLSGCSWYRDYICWYSVNRQPEIFDWKRFDQSVDELKKHHLHLDLFSHSAPDHARSPGPDVNIFGRPHKKYRMMPDDLFKYYHFNRKMAIHYKGRVEAFETWNEPDLLDYNSKTAWDFASLQKTAYLGIKAGNTQANVLHGAFCKPEIPEFTRICFNNDIVPYFDTSNWHIYSSLKEYHTIFKKISALQSEYGFADKALWVTENGFSYQSAGFGRGPSFVSAGGLPMLEFDAEQERAFAEFAVKAPLILRSLGVERDFIFRILPYNEGAGKKVWGMLRWNFTVKPAFIAYANLISQLGGAEYLGTCNLGTDIIAFTYRQPDASQTLVFWKKSPLESFSVPDMKRYRSPENTRIELKTLQTSPLILSDLMGKQSNPKVINGIVELTAKWEPQYLHGLRNLSYEPMAKTKPLPSSWNNHDLNVVLKADFAESQFHNTDSVILADGECFSVTVCNFSNTLIRGRLENLCGFKLNGLADELEIAPMSSRTVIVTLTGGHDQNIVIGGSFTGKKISRLYIPVWLNRPDDYNLVRIDTGKASKWKPNSSGTMKISYDPAAAADLIDTKFKPGTPKWSYPILPLEKIYHGMISDIAAVAFDIRGVSGSGVSAAHVMFDSIWLPFRFRGDRWHRIIVPVSSSDAAKAKNAGTLRIGLNPNSDEYQYYIKNITIYEKRKATP